VFVTCNLLTCVWIYLLGDELNHFETIGSKYTDSFFFIIITFTTVGYGNMTVLNNNNPYYVSKDFYCCFLIVNPFIPF